MGRLPEAGRALPHLVLFTLLVLDSGEVSLSDEAMNALVWVSYYGYSAYRKAIEKKNLLKSQLSGLRVSKLILGIAPPPKSTERGEPGHLASGPGPVFFCLEDQDKAFSSQTAQDFEKLNNLFLPPSFSLIFPSF